MTEESLDFFTPHYILEIGKVVYAETLSYNKPTKHDAIICVQHVLNAFVINVINLHSICLTTYTRQNCLVNNFADFPDVQVKNPIFI